MNREFAQVFENQDIYLDFTAWEECHFMGCNIIVNYGIFHLERCQFKGCRLTLSGHAENVAKLMYIFFPDKIPLILPAGVSPLSIEMGLDEIEKL